MPHQLASNKIAGEKKVVSVTIKEITDKGNGVGWGTTPAGKEAKVEVSFTIPGDSIEASLHHKRRGAYVGKLQTISTPSPDRITPKCVHFGVCGGCRWQQTTYEKQLEFKQSLVLKHFKDILDENCQIHPIIPSKLQWNYRNKMEFSFSSDSHRKHFLGLYMDSQKGKVLNLTECHLISPWFMDALKAVRAWWEEIGLDAYHPSSDSGSLRNLTLREGQRTGDRMVILTVSGNPDYAIKKHDIESFVAFVRDAVEPLQPNQNLSIYLRIQQTAKGMATNFYEMHLHGSEYLRECLNIKFDPEKPPVSLNFKIGPSSFFQPNSTQAEIFYSKAIELAKLTPQDVVYDLFCGAGTFGICAALRVQQVIGVELSPESVLDARANAANNNLKNVTILSGAVRHVLGQIQDEKLHPNPDVIMVDPPRCGIDPDAMQQLIRLGAPKLLYLSCNPITQAGNVQEFIQNGYMLTDILAIDQFPQTYHIENVAVLVKK